MGKNMYQIVDTKTRKVEKTGFATREEAKPDRNKLNDDTDGHVDTGQMSRFVVSRGTDHPLGESNTFVKHTKKRYS